MRACAVGFRWALAHGNILTLANCNLFLFNFKFRKYILSEKGKKGKSKTLIKMEKYIHTVGIAVAMVATAAALAPAITPSANHIY